MTNSDLNSTFTPKLLSPHWASPQDIPQAPWSYGAPKRFIVISENMTLLL